MMAPRSVGALKAPGWAGAPAGALAGASAGLSERRGRRCKRLPLRCRGSRPRWCHRRSPRRCRSRTMPQRRRPSAWPPRVRGRFAVGAGYPFHCVVGTHHDGVPSIATDQPDQSICGVEAVGRPPDRRVPPPRAGAGRARQGRRRRRPKRRHNGVPVDRHGPAELVGRGRGVSLATSTYATPPSSFGDVG